MLTTHHADGHPTQPSSLLWFVLTAVAAGAYGFVSAGGEHPGFALASNLIYRSEVGLAFLATIYVVGIAVWLAWFGKGFFEIKVAGSGIRASDPEVIGGVGQELVDMSSLIAAVMRRMSASKTSTGGFKCSSKNDQSSTSLKIWTRRRQRKSTSRSSLRRLTAPGPLPPSTPRRPEECSRSTPPSSNVANAADRLRPPAGRRSGPPVGDRPRASKQSQ